MRLIERHRNKRFQAFVVVTRTNVNPLTFAFLYQALRAQSRPITEVHEFQVSVRDANEILRACLAKQPRPERVRPGPFCGTIRVTQGGRRCGHGSDRS